MKTKKFLLSIGASIVILLCVCGIVYFTHDCNKHIEWNDAIAVDFDSGESRTSGICRICNKAMTFTNKIETPTDVQTQAGVEEHDCTENVEFDDGVAVDPITGDLYSSGCCMVCRKQLSFVNGELKDETGGVLPNE